MLVKALMSPAPPYLMLFRSIYKIFTLFGVPDTDYKVIAESLVSYAEF
jgi:hypothetical protein